MIPFLVASSAFVCVMAGALIGLWLSQRVPENCRDEHSREAIQLAAGMISFLAALVLGLLTASVSSPPLRLRSPLDCSLRWISPSKG
jgi:hypothetical protein